MYGAGCNVKASGPPPQLYYKEDIVRAQFYKVFYPEFKQGLEEFGTLSETFDLFNQEKEILSEKFISKCFYFPSQEP